MEAITQTKFPSSLPLSMLIPGRNPRTYFDPAALAELEQLVSAQGVNQPILVRPKAGKYEIVAGYRRVHVATKLFGSLPDYEIPVLVKELSDAEAEIAAVTENTGRDAMSPTEEAAEAAKVLGELKGDRDEAARRLGWSRSTLDKRLALMNCSEIVRVALNERKIDLGHAELFATLQRETQDKLLPVVIGEKKTVAELKAVVQHIAAKLTAAIFDKADCAACPHNSTMQASMFGESITAGSCTKPQCYNDKTEAALQLIADGLKEDYPIIRIVRAGDNTTRVRLEAEGPKGVGAEQAEACKACSDYGAAVSALPDALGKVFRGQCFNTLCNTKKVAARIKAEDEAQKQAESKKSSPAKPSGTASGSKEAVEQEKPVTTISETERMKTYRVALWRKAMKAEIVASPELSRQYLLAFCINGSARHIESSKLGEAFKKLTGKATSVASMDGNLQLIAEADPAVRDTLMTLLAATAVSSIEEHHLRQLAKFHQLDLRKHWKLDKEFLDLLTKSEIEVLAKDVGLDKAFGEGFKKLFADKKDPLIEKLLKVDGFNYSATIPKVIKY